MSAAWFWAIVTFYMFLIMYLYTVVLPIYRNMRQEGTN